MAPIRSMLFIVSIVLRIVKFQYLYAVSFKNIPNSTAAAGQWPVNITMIKDEIQQCYLGIMMVNLAWINKHVDYLQIIQGSR